MNYKTLLARLQGLTSEQLEQPVMVQLDFNWLPVVGTGITEKDDDVLPEGRFYLFID